MHSRCIYCIYTVMVFLKVLLQINAFSTHPSFNKKATLLLNSKSGKCDKNVRKLYNLAIFPHKGNLPTADFEQSSTEVYIQTFSANTLLTSGGRDISTVTGSEINKGKNKTMNIRNYSSLVTDLNGMFSFESKRHKRQFFNRLPIPFSVNNCGSFFSCDFNKNKTLQNCYCDAQCGNFNDCCDDFMEHRTTNTTVPLSKFADILSCRVNITSDSFRTFRGYWMVTRCRYDYPNTYVFRRCTSLTKYDVPVTDDRGIVYGNAYCAICNEVNSYRPWKVVFELNVKCGVNFSDSFINNSSFLHTRKILEQKGCPISFEPPTTSNEKARICNTVGSRFKQDICSKPFFGNIFPLNVVFAMSKTKTNGNGGCFNDGKFDLDTGLCFHKHCHQTDDSGCGQTGNALIQNHKMYIKIDFLSFSQITTKDAQETIAFFVLCLPTQHYGVEILPLYRRKSLSLYVSENKPLFETTTIYSLLRININVYITKPLSFKQLGVFQSVLDDIDWSYVRESNSNRSFGIWHEKNIPNTIMYTNVSVKHVPFGKYIVNNIKDSFTFGSFGKGRCRLPKQCNVSRGRPSKSEVNLTETIEKVEISCNFHEEDCQLNTNFEDDISNMLKPKSNMNDNEFIQALLTYVSLTFSSVAILLTAIVQRYIGTVKTTPGHISENIMFVMFLFNICYMLGIGMDNWFLCLLLAVLTHYFVLTCFTWVSIFVLHTMKTLRKIRQFSGRTSWNSPPFPAIFYFFGYVSPLMITIPSLIIDQCDCTAIVIGYTDRVCFPTGFPSSLFVFVGPVIAFVLFNMSCLLYLVCKLFHLNKVVSNQGISNSRSFVGVYIRLCLLSGLSWGLGVLSEWLHIDILRYIFIVLTGSHGLIFSVCILSTQVIRSDLRRRFFPKQEINEVNIEEIAS